MMLFYSALRFPMQIAPATLYQTRPTYTIPPTVNYSIIRMSLSSHVDNFPIWPGSMSPSVRTRSGSS